MHGKLGLQLSFRWVFKEKSNQMYPVMGEKQMSKRVRWDQRLQNFCCRIPPPSLRLAAFEWSLVLLVDFFAAAHGS